MEKVKQGYYCTCNKALNSEMVIGNGHGVDS